MSQRRPAPRPASRRSTVSPASVEEASPQGRLALVGSDTRSDRREPPVSEANGRSRHLSLGVHNILNPSEPRLFAAEGPGSISSRLREGEAGLAAQPSRTYGSHVSYFPGGSGASTQHAASIGNLNALARPPLSGTESPAATYSFPQVGVPRRPPSPRASHAPASSFEGERRHQSSGSITSPLKRRREIDSPEEARQQHGPRHAHRGSWASAASVASPSRAPDQIRGRPTVSPFTMSPVTGSQARPRSLHSPSAIQHALVQSQPGPSVGRPGEGAPAWPEVIRRQNEGRATAGPDGQQAFMTLPNSDITIPVQVDYSQASRRADEKRQRNAKASTRHRMKKKSEREEKERQLNELREEREQFLEEVDGLRRQRDFYRDERNRLREIVARTPGIYQHAAGPPSPSVQSAESHDGEMSPAAQSQMPTPSQGYASDQSSADPPPAAQHRMSGDGPDFPRPGFGPQAGPSTHNLAPLPDPVGHGGPDRSSSVSSGNGDRLPSFREIEGRPARPDLGPQEQDPRTGLWGPAPPRRQETGWATAPRMQYDGHGPPHWQ
ncbi:hypothetical protein HIM_07718 [Hirsutella minnesotensis 3608]|uniref:BZIP domain-containing protein n=1 Tax=Hirsutella minnesotensis 3608 TaxID=1043627 RepID=A0A0F7ZN14_9HYPO|nr:hypothetical protein HIM_07718 [Hirsutella minnesotensis 3608]